MFQSKIFIDLPSRETMREKTVGEWFTSLFGARPDLRTGREVMTISAYAILEGIVTAFEKAGMTNVISLMVDNRTVFLDTQDEPDDLAAMHQAAIRSGALNRRFHEMHIAFTHREEGMHIIIDVALHPQVMLGDEELTITLSGRLEELQHRPHESASRYRSRIRDFASDTGNFDTPREILDEVTERLAHSLRTTLPGAQSVHTTESQVQLVRPNARQMGRMRHLSFEDEYGPRYRPAPARYHGGVVVDPFYHYYYDPFYDFALAVMVGAAIEFAWHMSYVYFVDPAGTMLGYAHDIAYDTWVNEWDAYDALHFADDGSFYIDDSIPVFEYEGDYDDHYAYDASWDMEAADVFDPAEGHFVEAGWDDQPIAYDDYANTGYDDSPQVSHDIDYDTSADFHADDVYNTPVSDWDTGASDSSWNDSSGWDDGGSSSWSRDDENW